MRKELWRLGPNSEITVAAPVAAKDRVFVTGGYSPIRPIYAIRAGATGDISLGDEESGLDCLEQAYEVRDHWLCWIGVNPAFDSVRSNARFKTLMKKIGLGE